MTQTAPRDSRPLPKRRRLNAPPIVTITEPSPQKPLNPKPASAICASCHRAGPVVLCPRCSGATCAICARTCTAATASSPPTPLLSWTPTPTPSPVHSPRRPALALTNTNKNGNGNGNGCAAAPKRKKPREERDEGVEDGCGRTVCHHDETQAEALQCICTPTIRRLRSEEADAVSIGRVDALIAKVGADMERYLRAGVTCTGRKSQKFHANPMMNCGAWEEFAGGFCEAQNDCGKVAGVYISSRMCNEIEFKIAFFAFKGPQFRHLLSRNCGCGRQRDFGALRKFSSDSDTGTVRASKRCFTEAQRGAEVKRGKRQCARKRSDHTKRDDGNPIFLISLV
ncbi:hypothetical protein DFH07DRAFT_946082 [Mycena maculata]|uniref:Uncharacterized protein n=1 Tax=Mycena maculata TaxID=230809 RepID=A0AAD7HQW6_9AGAR|nr:hypothetical protein DFH07DRAFT_946082 [Mycena maculata]